jgi:hypothetical protein
MLLCKISLSWVHSTEHDMEHLTDARPGADSVTGLPGARLNYPENVVYSNSACLPTHVVFYTYA